jgi:small subunit ribosomal protein S6
VTCRVRKYEFIFILDPTLDDGVVAQSLDKYAKLIREQGGEVTHQENWGRRKFTYEIKHKGEGSYVFLRFRGEKKVVDELNRALRFDERVLRTLIVLDEEAEARNAAAQRRGRGPGAEMHRPAGAEHAGAEV